MISPAAHEDVSFKRCFYAQIKDNSLTLKSINFLDGVVSRPFLRGGGRKFLEEIAAHA